MPLKIVKDKETGATSVVYQPGPPAKIGTKLPAVPKLSHEIDYDMHAIQRALVPVQTKVRPVTSKGA